MKNQKAQLIQALKTVCAESPAFLLDHDQREVIHAIANIADSFGFSDVSARCRMALSVDTGKRAQHNRAIVAVAAQFEKTV